MPWLGALRQLDLDHFHLRIARVLYEALGIESAVRGAASEIAGSDFPDQVTPGLAMVGRDRSLATVVVEPAHLRALVERADRVGRQRAKAHRGNIEHTGRVWLWSSLADQNPEVRV